MRAQGLRGVVRGRKCRTTIHGDRAARPLYRINRQFQASGPNQLWVADFTYVATWAGFVYVAFVIDVFARRIIGWWVARSMHTDLVLDAPEQALWARAGAAGVVHHCDRGSQYLSIRYSERLAEARGRAFGWQRRRFLRQRARRDDHRVVHDRSHPPPRSVAASRSRGIRDPRVGRLVQSSSIAGTDRHCAAGGIGAGVPSSTKKVGTGTLTQTTESPESSVRFSVTAALFAGISPQEAPLHPIRAIHTSKSVLLRIAKMRDACILNVVVPAKAGTQRLLSKDTGFPRSDQTERERQLLCGSCHSFR